MSNITSPRIVMLCVPCEPSTIMYNEVVKKYNVAQVLYEEKESAKVILKRRIKKLGWWKVFGQILFQLSIQKILQKAVPFAVKRFENEGLIDATEIPSDKIIRVNSSNDPQTIELILSLKPDLIIINGTRILSKRFLEAMPCPVLNVHAGITPCYRGVHGAYWALVNNDVAHCGVTVHMVDTGVDTGGILAQALIKPTTKDHFSTYPILQFTAAMPLLMDSIDKVFKKQHQLQATPACTSGLWYHPTLWEYLYYRIVKGIK
jgi:folate-dependent phosphoribosylglycinamide formyltransferase PurN